MIYCIVAKFGGGRFGDFTLLSVWRGKAPFYEVSFEMQLPALTILLR